MCRFIAAERPPHLKAIAPWEGIADYYRELLGRGGIPNYAFVDYRGGGYCGETLYSTVLSYPLGFPGLLNTPERIQARTGRKTRAP